MRANVKRRHTKVQTANRITYLYKLFTDSYHLAKEGNVSLQKIVFVLAARAATEPELPASDEEDAKLAECSHWYARYVEALMEVTHAIKEGIRTGKITPRCVLTGLPIKTVLIRPWLIEDEREIAIDAYSRVMQDEVPARFDSEGWPDGEIMLPKGVRVSLEQADVWAASHGITDLGELKSLMSEPGVTHEDGTEQADAPTTAPGDIKASASNGIPKGEIICVEWPLPESAPPLSNILDELPKWVDSACVKVGQRGKGPKGSHLWNPAILAVCLSTKTPQKKWAVGKGTLTSFLRRSFPDYLEQWEAAAKLL